ncbi:hypothetical protein [Cellulomonas endophytica]|uniref:hypothetical protein n=1 Tax=Cellulomonas endophytica TaxID=2494735 RepID=UPI001011991C|nr:hypothetical protein [Cellulomonas endophytica]
MPGTTTSVLRTVDHVVRPVTAWSVLDHEPLDPLPVEAVDPAVLVERLRVDPAAVEVLHGGAAGAAEALRGRPELLDEVRRVHAAALLPGETPLVITDVTTEPVLSWTPATLVVHYRNPHEEPVVLASVTVTWAGEPFVVEQEVRADAREGTLELRLDEEHTLPVGPAGLDVTLWRADGARAAVRHTVLVLPSNPLAMALGPAGARVTGSWSLRGDHRPESDTFVTECEITITNGDPRPVAMGRSMSWEFWDGPVGGGTRVEAGTLTWSAPITVPALGAWRGSVHFSSPRGSGVFGRYDRKEDLALAVSATAVDGRVLRAEITARTLLAYGVNIIKVGTFGAQEHADLYAAVDRMREVFEARDITLRGVDRRLITAAQAGGYTTVGSEDEYRDMLEAWSCANDYVDVFVVQDFAWAGYNGYAGDIPGPATKGGRKDGVAVEKTGYTDGSGTARLDVETLALLVGHEVGHYLGLAHQETTDNLMRSSSGVRGAAVDYEQYRLMFPHGYVVHL